MSVEQIKHAIEHMDPTELALGAGLIGAILVIMAVGAFAWYFISALGLRKMYIKAGEPGWAAFIPYYRSFIRFKMAWDVKLFWVFLAVSLVVHFLGDAESALITMLAFVCSIVGLVLALKLDIRVAQSFGKSKAWGVFLFFLPFIASLILGYGKAEYIGNSTKTTM